MYIETASRLERFHDEVTASIIYLNVPLQILCTHAKDQLYWEGVTVYNKSSTRVFQNAIRGGFHMSTSSTLYIGRIKLKQGARLGMVISPKKKEAGLWIYVKRKGYVRISEFQLLKYKMEECEAN